MLIYGIIETETNECIYVGSTKDLDERIRQHFNSSDRSYPLYLYILNKGWDKFTFETLETVDTQDKKILLEYERYYIDELHPKYNSHTPILTEEERKEYRRQKDSNYYYNHRDEKLEKHKVWIQNNKNHVLEYAKTYYQENKESLRESNKQRAKDYYYENREKIREKQRLAYLQKKKTDKEQ
jgi:group I intron endonuclease